MKKPFLIRFAVIMILSAFTAFYFYIEMNGTHQIKDVSILQGNDKSPKVSFTFNVSWGNEKIYDILAVLRKERVRATFFLSGEWIERHPHIVEIIEEDKHEIGMIGYRYTNYIDNRTEDMKRDIAYGYEVFKKLDITPTYIRKPNGTFDEDLQNYVERFQLQPVHYSLQSFDTQATSANSIHDQIIDNIQNGDIVLLHGSDTAVHTAEALQKIIPKLKNKQMQLVTVTELLQEIDIEEKVLD